MNAQPKTLAIIATDIVIIFNISPTWADFYRIGGYIMKNIIISINTTNNNTILYCFWYIIIKYR